MSKAERHPGKRHDGNGDRTPVPPYPAEVSATWQAFRVKVREDDSGDPPPPDAESSTKPPHKLPDQD